jgi:beta-glucanase (GH16 family)
MKQSNKLLHGKRSYRKARLVFIFAIVFAFVGIGSFKLLNKSSNIPSTNAATNYSLFWADEFNGTSVDTSRWGVYHNNYGSGNNELECNTPSNATTSGGSLVITGKKQTYACPGAGTYQYTSAFLGSRDASTPRYYPLYGKYEMRARIPHGQGLWPAFWLRHKSGASNAEVDILEEFHNQAPGKVTSTLHFPNTLGPNVAKKSVLLETPTQATGGWHTYAVVIEPAGTNAVKFTFLIDDVESFNYTNTNASSWVNGYENAAWDIAVNMAIGGNWVGHPDQQLGYLPYKNWCSLNSATPPSNNPVNCPTTGIFLSGLAQKNAEYIVDYVRVYAPSTAIANPPGDINNDGVVNALDLSIVLSKWGTSDAAADINNDNAVNALDLSIILSNWGT